MNQKAYHSFTNLYTLQKTLRFELKPQGKTMENFNNSNLFLEDEIRTNDYKVVKKLMDDYHRRFILECLKSSALDWKPLANSFSEYKKNKGNSNSATLKKILDNEKNRMKCEIERVFRTNEKFKCMFSEKLIKLVIEENSDNEENLRALNSFNKFSTYFKGYHENRRNAYATLEKASIAHRIVEDNFPKFFENSEKYAMIKETIPELIMDAERECIEENIKFDNLFTIDNFNEVLSQEGIDIYNYAIGGFNTEKNEKFKGLNECLNKYYQDHPSSKKIKMARLFRQILGLSKSYSFIPAVFNDDDEVFDSVLTFLEVLQEKCIFNRIIDLIGSYREYDADMIYISQKSLSQISVKIFGHWSTLGALMEAYAAELKGDSGLKKNRRPIEKWLSSDFFSLKDICGAIGLSDSNKTFDIYSQSIIEMANNLQNNLCNSSILKKIPLCENQAHLQLKELLDDISAVQYSLKSFRSKEELQRDMEFYSELDNIYDTLSGIIPLYNMVRNYVTKKKFNQEKIRLMFGNPTLADGWDLNKEQENTAVILLRDEKYYLGIMNPKKKIKDWISQNDDNVPYRKMVYKFLPGANKMFPKVFILAESNIDKYSPTEEIIYGYNNGYHKKGDNFDLSFCHKLIDFFKSSILKHQDWKNFEFNFSPTESYEDISQFYREVDKQGYAMNFVDVSQSAVDQFVDEGRLYLFQIFNKDFSEGSKGNNENLHTMYWKSVFSEENLANVCIRLNGYGELFFREKTNMEPIVHKRGEILINRIDKDRKSIPNNLYYEIFRYLNGRTDQISDSAKRYIDDDLIISKESRYDIVKDRRYTEDKLFFHVPITLNHSSTGDDNLNRKTIDHIVDSKDLHILGIDRGERNLLYYSLINRKGEIVEQGDLNTLCGFDYHEKLGQREKERDESRKSWSSIETIKDLKEGYLSHVIHAISKMIVKYNAVVVLEDLNYGFKHSRTKIEKQIYQKFEKMLIDKFNYLVFKDCKPSDAGGVLNGYQLTRPFKSFSEIGKQTGVIFYIPAAYTSKIDPTTGFVNIFNTSKISTQKSMYEFISKFKSVSYNAASNSFAFKFDYRDFAPSSTDYRNIWTANSIESIERYSKKDRSYVQEFPTEKIIKALDSNQIKYGDGENILPHILNCDMRSIADIYHAFLESIKIRHIRNGKDVIISPIVNSKGYRYESDKVEGMKEKLPDNPDANGSFCIAMKGEMLFRGIEEKYDPDQKSFSMPKITNAEWLKFMQTQRSP